MHAKSMKNSVLLIFLTVFTCCEGKKQTNVADVKPSAEIESSPKLVMQSDSVNTKEIFQTATIRYSQLENGYTFNLPFNYRIKYVPNQNSQNSYYKFQWKVTDDFVIDSNSGDFKHFSVSNFIPYLSSSSYGEGDFFVVKNKSKIQLNISDFLKSFDEILYKDDNSAIISDYGKLKAFYFEYLPKNSEYLVYLSDIPFQNKRPEAKTDEMINQLLHQIRMAKNISKPIKSQDKSWNSYEKQLSVLEKDFFKKLNLEVKKEFTSDQNLKSFSPSDQGNNRYYTVFSNNKEIEMVWQTLYSVKNNTTMSITDADKNFDYLREANFRFFYNADYQQIFKTDHSTVFERKSQNAFCLITKTKNKKLIIMKEFPALQQMPPNYYNNEIEFYRELFENYN